MVLTVELKSLIPPQHIPGTAGRRYLLTVELKSLTTPSCAGPTDQHMSGIVHPTLHIVHRLWRRLRQLITSSPYPVDMDRGATPTSGVAVQMTCHKDWERKNDYSLGIHRLFP